MQIFISVPQGSEVKIKSGDKIDPKTPLYETLSTSHHSINLAQQLKVDPAKIFHYLKKFVGEKIKKNEVLAVKKGLLSSKKIVSPYEGIIKEIDHSQGQIIISSQDKKNIVFAPVVGEVEAIKNQQISIIVKDGKKFNLKKAADDFGGEALYWEKDDHRLITSSDISGKILVGEIITSYLQSKMEALGIKGYVLLYRLPEETNLPFCQIKTIEELKEIMKYKYPYCYIDSKSCKITFYK